MPTDAGSASTIEGDIGRLREDAVDAPLDVAVKAWDLLGELGSDRDIAALDAVFGTGLPPRGLRGPWEHDLLASPFRPVHAVVSRLRRPLPWLGKSFDPATDRGTNDFRGSALWPLRVLVPFGRWERSPRGVHGLRFDTLLGDGAAEPAPKVLVIDYPVPVRPIRDELVEVVPGIHLGRALSRTPRGSYINVVYWRLRAAAVVTGRP